jgi:hypothetical protein
MDIPLFEESDSKIQLLNCAQTKATSCLLCRKGRTEINPKKSRSYCQGLETIKVVCSKNQKIVSARSFQTYQLRDAALKKRNHGFHYVGRAANKTFDCRKKVSSKEDVEVLKHIFEHAKQRCIAK